MTNPTLLKFGYPNTLVFETENWCVLLRPAQVTIGALVVGTKGKEQSLGDIPTNAFKEFPLVCKRLEAGILDMFQAKRFNYIALMMVDPQVHFHVLPRYENEIIFDGARYTDASWPRPPDLGSHLEMPTESFGRLKMDLRESCK